MENETKTEKTIEDKNIMQMLRDTRALRKMFQKGAPEEVTIWHLELIKANVTVMINDEKKKIKLRNREGEQK